MPECFAPSVDSTCSKLILGSMPGVKSLEQAQYYAHPQNAFWRIMAKLFGAPYPFASYDDKLNLLLSHHIALWDVISTCARDGAAWIPISATPSRTILNAFSNNIRR